MLAVTSGSRTITLVGALIAGILAAWTLPARAADVVDGMAPDGIGAATRKHAPQIGTASWYGREHAGRRTASGIRFDPDHLTAAHRHLPLGSKVRVTHVASGQSVIVTINDRGPYVRGRIIDLSRAAAVQLGMRASGLATVRVELL